MRVLYALANGVMHALHLAIIGFTCLGWLLPRWRLSHLAFVALMLGSWYLLSPWMGPGYCPITDWHWRLKQRYGPGRPAVTYIGYCLAQLTGLRWEASRVDRITVGGTALSGTVSLALYLLSRLR